VKIIITEEQYNKLKTPEVLAELLSPEEQEQEHQKAMQKTGFWGKAGAGCIIMSRFSGRVLLPLRSIDVKEPGTWGTWGGAIDENESPEEAVLREVSEEAGYYGPKKVIPLHVFKDPSGFRYYNFLVLVNKEFQPRINWETEKFGWFHLDELPSPLHFGLKGIINDPNDVDILMRYAQEITESLASKNKENISESAFYGLNTTNITKKYLNQLV